MRLPRPRPGRRRPAATPVPPSRGNAHAAHASLAGMRPVGAARRGPQLRTASIALAFHLAAEGITALLLIVSGYLLVRGRRSFAWLGLVANGMLMYTVIVSPGYFAQLDQWPLFVMFALPLAAAAFSVWQLAPSSTAAARLPQRDRADSLRRHPTPRSTEVTAEAEVRPIVAPPLTCSCSIAPSCRTWTTCRYRCQAVGTAGRSRRER